MDYFEYRDGLLHAEDVPVTKIASHPGVGMPFYCYSARTMRRHFTGIREAFRDADPLIAYSVKANGNLAVLEILMGEGAGFDVVSGGELFRVKCVGAAPEKVVFAGVGKTEREISEALDFGVGWFNVESGQELGRIEKIARQKGVTAGCALRINPDVDPRTHEKITTGKKENKFGIDLETARKLFLRFKGSAHVRVEAIHAHIGSQITEVEPYEAALACMAGFVKELRAAGCTIGTVNMGGGFGIFYQGGEAKPATEFAGRLLPMIKELGVKLIIEPGRFIVGNAGLLVTEVQYVKKTPAKNFIVVDTGMQHLIRPVLYDAFHRIWPVEAPFPEGGDGPVLTADVVGPICESSDVLAKDRNLPEPGQGDLLAIFSAGAYGFAMASNYNSHTRPAEVLVDGDTFKVVREREKYADLVRGEKQPDRME